MKLPPEQTAVERGCFSMHTQGSLLLLLLLLIGNYTLQGRQWQAWDSPELPVRLLGLWSSGRPPGGLCPDHVLLLPLSSLRSGLPVRRRVTSICTVWAHAGHGERTETRKNGALGARKATCVCCQHGTQNEDWQGGRPAAGGW